MRPFLARQGQDPSVLRPWRGQPGSPSSWSPVWSALVTAIDGRAAGTELRPSADRAGGPREAATAMWLPGCFRPGPSRHAVTLGPFHSVSRPGGMLDTPLVAAHVLCGFLLEVRPRSRPQGHGHAQGSQGSHLQAPDQAEPVAWALTLGSEAGWREAPLHTEMLSPWNKKKRLESSLRQNKTPHFDCGLFIENRSVLRAAGDRSACGLWQCLRGFLSQATTLPPREGSYCVGTVWPGTPSPAGDQKSPRQAIK